MKIKVNRASFLTEFGFAELAAAKRDVRPILQYVKLIARERSVLLESTDGDVAVRVELNGESVEIEEEGEVALAPKIVKRILATTTDETLVFESENATTVSIFGETARFRLTTIDASEFPEIKTLGDSPIRTFGADVLETAIMRTTFAIDSENVNYALGGVNFEFRENETFAVATDGRRLADQRIDGDSNSTGADQTAIIPPKALDLIIRAFKLDRSGVVSVAVADDRTTFQTERILISTSLMLGRFPAWRLILPDKSGKKRVDFLAGSLATAIRQAAVVAGASNEVRLIFESGTLCVESKGDEIGASSVQIPILYSDERVETRYDARFLDEFFRRLKPEAPVSFYFLVDKPSFFETDDGYSYVVMPLL